MFSFSLCCVGSPGPWVGKSLWVLVSGFGLLKKCRLSTGKSGGAFQIGVNTHKQSFEGKAEREVLVTMMSMHVLCTAVYSCTLTFLRVRVMQWNTAVSLLSFYRFCTLACFSNHKPPPRSVNAHIDEFTQKYTDTSFITSPHHVHTHICSIHHYYYISNQKKQKKKQTPGSKPLG